MAKEINKSPKTKIGKTKTTEEVSDIQEVKTKFETTERYSAEDLQEFKEIILNKIKKSQEDYELYKSMLDHKDNNDTMDTSPTFKVLEEGANVLSKEEIGKIAQRQLKFIQHLQAALFRIENGTYGICRETGKLISKERLKVVPHATLSIDAKNNR